MLHWSRTTWSRGLVIQTALLIYTEVLQAHLINSVPPMSPPTIFYFFFHSHSQKCHLPSHRSNFTQPVHHTQPKYIDQSPTFTFPFAFAPILQLTFESRFTHSFSFLCKWFTTYVSTLTFQYIRSSMWRRSSSRAYFAQMTISIRLAFRPDHRRASTSRSKACWTGCRSW